jgi:hypothetical protein
MNLTWEKGDVDERIGTVGLVNGDVIYYTSDGEVVHVFNRVKVSSNWSDVLDKHITPYGYLELTNPLLLNCVCYLIETGQLHID